MVIEKKRAYERRAHQRHPMVRGCKVRDRRTLLFCAGKTSDLSVTGALLCVDRVRPFAPGDELDVVVAWGNDAIVTGDSMMRARIRRVTPIDYHHQAIAVQFSDAIDEQAAATLPAKAA